MLTLILGGARSGKTRFAEGLARAAEAAGRSVVYLATAQALDDEMTERVRRHRADRPAHWTTLEETLALAAALEDAARPDRCILVDCLTLWLTNLLLADDATAFERERGRLLDVLPRLPGEVLLVSNEVGMGLVPISSLGRRFVDESGRLHQDVAALADRVRLVVAGIPVAVKG